MATYETVFGDGSPFFRVENLKVELFDELPPGTTPPTTIFQDDQDWGAVVSWDTDGLATGMVAGEWHLLIAAESIGPGDEKILYEDPIGPAGDHIFPLEPPTGGGLVSYSRTVEIDAGELSVAGGHGVTLYRLIVSLTYFDASDAPRPERRGPIACFEDGITVQIYESTP